MLSVKSVFALDNTCMTGKSFFFRSCHKGVCHVQISYCRILYGAYSRLVPSIRMHLCNYDISAFYLRLHTAAGSNADKVSAPHRESSSMAMEADGPPIPVDVTLTFTRPGFLYM